MARIGLQFDNYVLTKQLGVNSFGAVWAARESITERLVSINFLKTEDDYEIARFVRAISLLSRLNHPAIAVHTGHGYLGHRPYLATELVQGPALSTLVAQGGRMDELRVLQIALQIADGLEHAWERAEVVHRNLGPQSIQIELASISDGQESVRIRVGEFGHALGKRLIDTFDPDEVAEEEFFQEAARKELVGNAATISPEQAAGARLTFSSDMYSLGATMYQLLTGSPPFTGTDDEVRAAHMRATPMDLQLLLPGLQPGTNQLIKRLLSKRPNGRFVDWGACRANLRQLCDICEVRRAPRQPTPISSKIVKKTETFHRTVVGKSIPSGELDEVLPPPQFQGASALTPLGSPMLSEAQYRLAEQAMRQHAGPPMHGMSEAPAVEDGLTREQRMAVWAMLFRNPALLDAALSKSPEATSAVAAAGPSPAAPAITVPSRVPKSEVSPNVEADPDLPMFEPEPEPEILSPVYADLFAPTTDTVIKPSQSAALPPSPTAAPSADVPGNPVKSRHWKAVLDILSDAVLGSIRKQGAKPTGLTQRLTQKIRLLVSSRTSMQTEAANLLDSGRFDEAETAINKIAVTIGEGGTSGNDATLCLLRARLQALRGDFPAAISWAQNTIRQEGVSTSALAIVGLSHLHQRRVQSAMAVFDEMTNLSVDSPIGPLGQSAILFLAGLESKSRLALSEAIGRQSHPSIIRFAVLHARTYNDHDGEIGFLEQLLTGTSADWATQERLQEIRQIKDKQRSRTVPN